MVNFGRIKPLFSLKRVADDSTFIGSGRAILALLAHWAGANWNFASRRLLADLPSKRQEMDDKLPSNSSWAYGV
jgi:hypothetical protein